ncbi:MAG: tRNA (adenosine(37)-N6)-threonylcarbamoyltransferase complex ATPase subunit type 1 TsaE [Campylobacterales bacterium]|nr:tRNA (adenosine(37)-N6)-threonylcarbamoyltransferase complex ATPase subunit type 1 TsaE [Campylobacterales bacterium]
MKITSGIEQLDKVVEYLKSHIDLKSTVVILQGDLASGKTTFVKSFVKSLGVDQEVTSPTFSIQCCYDKNIYHYDMYNKTLQEFISLGFLEEFENEGVHFVEWGDQQLQSLLHEYGFNCVVVKINKLDDQREYIIEA